MVDVHALYIYSHPKMKMCVPLYVPKFNTMYVFSYSVLSGMHTNGNGGMGKAAIAYIEYLPIIYSQRFALFSRRYVVR